MKPADPHRLLLFAAVLAHVAAPASAEPYIVALDHAPPYLRRARHGYASNRGKEA